jgi:hypothetical protein
VGEAGSTPYKQKRMQKLKGRDGLDKSYRLRATPRKGRNDGLNDCPELRFLSVGFGNGLVE